MEIKYKVDVLKKLKEKGYSSYVLQKQKILSNGSMEKLRRRQNISMDVLIKVSLLLNCELGELIELNPDVTAIPEKKERAKTHPKINLNDCRTTIRFQNGLKGRIENEAQRQGRSFSAIVVEAVEEYLDRKNG